MHSQDDGAAITVVTRHSEDFTDDGSKAAYELAQYLNSVNVKVIHKSKMHQKYAIIDQNIVWYGSVNFLSFGFGEESVIRLESYDIANELLGIL